MLKKIQQDFSYYSHEFKDNYRKGVHRLRTILANRAQAQAFVSNAGGTAVVLGYEPSAPDKNAQELYALLAASPYIDDAVQTFLGSIYEAGAESQDAMYSDSARCLEILHDPVMARAAGAGTVSAGKWIATLAGQSCNLYRDMNAVAASDIAMTAVAASETAMAAVAASRVAMAAIIGNSTALNAVVSSSTAMAAVINSEAARTALVSSSDARKALKASSLAVEMSLVSSDGQYWNSAGTKTMRGLILYTKAGNTDNAFTITKVDSTSLASNNNARNAATSGSTGYKDWLEAFPNSSWVLSSITFYAYYRTTKIKYIPC